MQQEQIPKKILDILITGLVSSLIAIMQMYLFAKFGHVAETHTVATAGVIGIGVRSIKHFS